MKKKELIEEKLLPRNMTLTPSIIQKMQEEANQKANGNTSLLLRMILIKRYKL